MSYAMIPAFLQWDNGLEQSWIYWHNLSMSSSQPIFPRNLEKKNPKQPINFCNTASWGQSSRNSPPLFLKFPILIAAASYKTINKQHFGKGWHLPGRFFFACATLKNFLPIIFLHCRFKSCRKTRCGGEKHELREFWGRERAWTSTFGWSSCATGMIYSAGAQGNHRGLLAWCLIHPGEVFWWRLGEKKNKSLFNSSA